MFKLFIVPTPIGNLEDITLRSIRTLKESDIILAEDTRKSAVLLKHYNISTKMYSHHMHNEHKTVNKWTKEILSGKVISLITDAGTPGISDPGYLLVRECIKNNIEVNCLPGPTAFIPALINSGIPCNRFVFEGFLPLKKGRKSRLINLSKEKRTIILYESPHKLIKTLHQIALFFDENRKISVSREITKKYEETIRGTIYEVLHYFTSNVPKGEFVIIIKGEDE
tara:strand:+ start:307 stop:981 length:675 start_codon:yes stop_codon:yes gene_type:complete